MKKTLFIALFVAAVAAPAFAQEATEAAATQTVAAPSAVNPARRELILSADGARIGRIDRLTAAGDAKVIYLGRMVTIPLATLSRTDDALVTSLTRREVQAID